MMPRKSLYFWGMLILFTFGLVLHLIKETGRLSSRTEELQAQLKRLLSDGVTEDQADLRFIETDMKGSLTIPLAFSPGEKNILKTSVSNAKPYKAVYIVNAAESVVKAARADENDHGYLNDIMADETWIEKRKELVETAAARKVVIFGYMRGGTSLLLEVFNQDGRAHAWYEPLGAVYGHIFGLPQFRSYTKIVFSDKKNVVYRDTTQMETNTFKELFKGIFECNFPVMPSSVLVNTFLMRSHLADEYVQCIQHTNDSLVAKFEHNCLAMGCLTDHCGGTGTTVTEAIENDCAEYLSLARGDLARDAIRSLKPTFNFNQKKMDCFAEYGQCMTGMKKRIDVCLEQTNFQNYCKERKIRVAKVLRLKMKEYEVLANEFPDMSLIFYTRDPRAIANSRQFGGNNVNLWMTETKQICKEMQQDFYQMEKLKRMFPGLILNMRYEDLVEQPVEKLRKIYAHFNEQPNDTVKKWLVYAMFASDDDSAFGVHRKDSRETRDKWKSIYPTDVVEKVTHDPLCEPILSLLGYL